MMKIFFVSPENLARTVSNQIGRRHPAFIIVPLAHKDDSAIDLLGQFLGDDYKFARATYDYNRKGNFYRDLARQLNLSLLDERGQHLNIKSLRAAVKNNIDDRNVFFFDEGSKLFELSSFKPWLDALLERGAVIITSEYKDVDEGNKLLFVRVRLDRRPGDENLETISTGDEGEKVRWLALGSLLSPRRWARAIDGNGLKSPPALALFFSAGLLMAFLPPVVSSLNGTVLYILASCALVWFIVWG